MTALVLPPALSAAPPVLVATIGTAVTGVAVGLVQVADVPAGQHVVPVCLGVMAVLQLPVLFVLARATGSAAPAAVSASGAVPLFVQANVLGHDASWSSPVGAPIHLALLAGLVWLAARTARLRLLPTTIAVALPCTWVATIVLSSYGGSLLAAACWLVLALRLSESGHPPLVTGTSGPGWSGS